MFSVPFSFFPRPVCNRKFYWEVLNVLGLLEDDSHGNLGCVGVLVTILTGDLVKVDVEEHGGLLRRVTRVRTVRVELRKGLVYVDRKKGVMLIGCRKNSPEPREES